MKFVEPAFARRVIGGGQREEERLADARQARGGGQAREERAELLLGGGGIAQRGDKKIPRRDGGGLGTGPAFDGVAGHGMLGLTEGGARKTAQPAAVLVEDEEESTKDREQHGAAMHGQQADGAERAGRVRVQGLEDIHRVQRERLIVGLGGKLGLERGDNGIGGGQRDAILSGQRRHERRTPERVRHLADLERAGQAHGHEDGEVHEELPRAREHEEQQGHDGEDAKG